MIFLAISLFDRLEPNDKVRGVVVIKPSPEVHQVPVGRGRHELIPFGSELLNSGPEGIRRG